ncbi:MAG: aminotransferase class I/II-fold pyridoxal phosphate-dependent enzyme [Edaphocola sp.]
MKIATAQRLDGIGEYYFATKLRQLDDMRAKGIDIINLGIGSPDLPPHDSVIAALAQSAAQPANHAYQPYKGILALRKAMADWYALYYGVSLNADTDILPLIGSKEGVVHVCMTWLGNGDAALVPNPGYPAYAAAVKLAGAMPHYYSLTEENDWFPDLELLQSQLQGNEKLMFVNYPHMPSGKAAGYGQLAQLVAFAKRNNILLVSDNPYSFILNDNPLSLLSLPGAMDVAVELNSLSKSHNMAGWRVGMLCGSAERISQVLQFKSNMDSGMFRPIQEAAVAALGLGSGWYQQLNEVYARRRSLVHQLLDDLGCSYGTQQAGLFVWARIPEQEKDGYGLSDKVLAATGVFITPGGIFGSRGNGYVRVSLCCSEAMLQKATSAVKNHLETTNTKSA